MQAARAWRSIGELLHVARQECFGIIDHSFKSAAV